MDVGFTLDPVKKEEAIKLFLEARPMPNPDMNIEDWINQHLKDYFEQILRDGKHAMVLKQGLMDCSHYIL